MSDDARAHRRGMGFAAASFVSTAILTTVSAVVTSRIYGIDLIGDFALIAAGYITVSRLSATGEQTAMVNRLAVLGRRDEHGSAIFVSVLGFSFFITSAIAGVVTAISVGLLRGPIDRPDLVRASIVMVLVYISVENLAWNLDAAFSALHGAADMFIARMIQTVSFLVGSIYFGLDDPQVEGLVTAHIISVCLAAVWRVLRTRRYLARPRREAMPAGVRELPAILRFGVRLIPGTLANGIANQAPIWVLGATLAGSPQGNAQIGGFSRASTLSARLEEAGYRAHEITYPELVRAHTERSDERLNDALRNALRPLSLVLALIIGIVAGAADGIMKIFGDGFDEAAGALAFLVLATCVYSWTIVAASILPAMDRPGLGATIAVCRSVLIIGLVFPGAIYGGITGTAAAIAAAHVIGAGATWVISSRIASTFDYELRNPVDTRLIIPTLACAGVAYAVDSTWEGFLALVFAGAAATTTYLAIALAIGVVPREWVTRARALLNRRRSEIDVG